MSAPDEVLAPVVIPVFTTPQGEAAALLAYQVVMDQWGSKRQELTIPTSFGQTYVIAGGPVDGPPVVLLHALFATAASWYRNVEGLNEVYRTYCVDVIGEANKSRPTRPIASMDDFLQWFTELLDGLGVDTVYLVGNSYGGFTAAYYAMKLPKRIRKLVLIGPASTIQPMTPFILHMFIPKALYSALPWLPGLTKAMRRSVDWMHAGLPRDPLWAPLFSETMMHGSLINRVFPRVYSREEFSAIEAPVLLVLGEAEVIYKSLQAAIRTARDLIPGVEVELIPEAHHITALAQPDLVNRRMQRFFAQNDPDI